MKYFNSLDVWTLQRVDGSTDGASDPFPPDDPPPPTDDDVPF